MRDSILTVVDAESFDKTHFESEAALKQITYGDIVLLNKTDLVSEDKLVELETFIRDKKDTAKILRTQYGKVALPLILGVELTLDTQTSPHIINAHPRKIIGVGNVGRTPGQASYTIYNPNTNQVDFKTVYYGNNKGFEAQPQSARAIK